MDTKEIHMAAIIFFLNSGFIISINPGVLSQQKTKLLNFDNSKPSSLLNFYKQSYNSRLDATLLHIKKISGIITGIINFYVNLHVVTVIINHCKSNN